MSATYDVEIHGVREVSLLGTADPDLWRSLLADYRLQPTVTDGRAEIMISACEGRFRGIKFRELSISVMTENTASPTEGSAFLVQAFNSRRLFAWVERTFFHTPYDRADICVEVSHPAIELTLGGQIVLRASMHRALSLTGQDARPASVVKQDGWEGLIHLPRRANRPLDPLRLFRGKLSGVTHYFDFVPSDQIQWKAPSFSPVFSWLTESDYQPEQWIIRPDATHGKSKTSIRAE